MIGQSSVSEDPEENWANNDIQFPRLLGEMNAVVEFTDEQKAALSESMDLTWEQIGEILSRAQDEWDRIKAMT